MRRFLRRAQLSTGLKGLLNTYSFAATSFLLSTLSRRINPSTRHAIQGTERHFHEPY